MTESKRFWSRTKVGVASGIVGLVIGMSGSGSEAEQPPSNDAAEETVRADLAEAIEQKSALEDDLNEAESEISDAESGSDAALKEARQQARAAQRAAVNAAVAKARKQEQKKAAAAVAAAREEAEDSTSNTVVPFAGTGGSTDPQFSYCYEANDAGYGSYVQGQDPEYAWYDDRDGDGVVCEF